LILATVALAVPVTLLVHLRSVKGSEPTGRLVVSADGLAVTDTVTKLLWQIAVNSTDNGQGAAVSYCSTLNLESTTGWRLPTVKELASIVDYESPTSPMIDTAAFGIAPTSNPYATSTIVPAGGQAYAVSFATGLITTVATGYPGGPSWRCVHTAP
jgi:hypothetical protein